MKFAKSSYQVLLLQNKKKTVTMGGEDMLISLTEVITSLGRCQSNHHNVPEIYTIFIKNKISKNKNT